MSACGRNRREFLWQAGGGFTGLVLKTLLFQDGYPRNARAGDGGTDPLAPKEPHFPPRARNVIFLFMYGGPSQVDLFDPKPILNQKHGQTVDIESRKNAITTGTLLGSPFRFDRHGESGIEVSELYPNLARCVDDMAIIRSMWADSFAHGSAMIQMNTGSLFQGKPCLGSWAAYGLGTMNRNLPAFVVLLDPRGGPIGGAPNWSAGYMPATYQGTQFRTSGDPIINLSPRGGISRTQQRAQLDLLGAMNRTHQAARPHETELAARIESYELAYRMQAHAPEAVDLEAESEATRTLYGMDDPVSADFGRKCLLARRLVERGVRFVQIYSGGGHFDENWDAHNGIEKNHRLHCRETDRPISGLLIDLKRRGLLDDTLVVWTGEFGRMPTSQNGTGRDHNPKGFTAWMAGGGVKGGVVYGATDELGYAAVENPVHVHDLHATILHLLGFDHTQLTYFHGGREQRLTDVHGRVVEAVLA
ncbi:MAG: hypothetical protein KatS3mg108_1713 [Isosphaeraceae bacterium]|jgi:hypothetical protein|nr:MAG: hypothetical protein KatS3mg108_1713 [Isosphaeraceae bacterium]